eukprot:NODE_10402_length_1354_cov_10.140994.p2 GENE.NODE_10402_length_1354_cov_10.140994~~NODE_10402_length_1354_cov_10.140994.p2  ORF type:complete len:231 (-),score=45.21 NODE_10402_length_1354_cov_10.140994:481-1173(-)
MPADVGGEGQQQKRRRREACLATPVPATELEFSLALHGGEEASVITIDGNAGDGGEEEQQQERRRRNVRTAMAFLAGPVPTKQNCRRREAFLAAPVPATEFVSSRALHGGEEATIMAIDGSGDEEQQQERRRTALAFFVAPVQAKEFVSAEFSLAVHGDGEATTMTIDGNGPDSGVENSGSQPVHDGTHNGASREFGCAIASRTVCNELALLANQVCGWMSSVVVETGAW